MPIMLNQQIIETDSDGYLANLENWSPAVAEKIAEDLCITLTEEHWEIIYLLRGFYQTYDLSPAMRPLVKYIREKLGPNKGNSIHLMRLFPESPARLASKIAGLPRPENCL
ncbi:MAG: TusE/DsrC/DsvC family sulfur relay protein [Pseudomonadales bacterium]|nr:TusE/DsrC/DsvC family sulfur relay protein [Pseudomonadales bacterium]